MYNQIGASKCEKMVLQYCWKFLEHSEKWMLRNEEDPLSRKGATITLYGEEEEEEEGEDDDEPALQGVINKVRTDEAVVVEEGRA
jgi:hypothetical protein